MKCRLICTQEKLYNDLMDLIRAYYPYVEDAEDGEPMVVEAEQEGGYTVCVRFLGRIWRVTQSCA